MNYKQDLLDIVKEHNLQILKIDCKYTNTGDSATENNNINNLDQLNFGSLLGDGLEGIVYCHHAISKQPIWITRVNDGYTGWWQLNKVPDFYKTLK